MKKNKSSKPVSKKRKEKVKNDAIIETNEKEKNEIKNETAKDKVKEKAKVKKDRIKESKEEEQQEQEHHLPEEASLPSTESEQVVIDLNKAYLLNAVSLLLQSSESLFNGTEEEFTAIMRKFKSKKELEEIVLQNGKLLFGTDTLLIDTRMKTGIEFPEIYIPNAILFDFKNQEKPMCA